MHEKAEKMFTVRRFIFGLVVSAVLFAVCVGGVSGAEPVTTWDGLYNAIESTPLGGSVEIFIDTTSSGDIAINSDALQLNIKGKTVIISNYGSANVVFMKSGNSNNLNIFEIGSATDDNGNTYAGSLTLNGVSPGSITLDRSGSVGDLLQPYGTGVEVLKGGRFIMNGDVTIQNQRVSRSDEAAGVHVRSGGTFIMNGGSIINNKATTIWGGESQAGGVFIEEGADFTMSGNSIISRNYRVNGLSIFGSKEINFGGAGAYYTICFNQNDDSGSTYYQQIPLNTPTSLTENTYLREGYVFANWNTRASGYGGQTYTDKQIVTFSDAGSLNLYAWWTPEEYTLIFDTDGGEPASFSITASYGELLSVPEVIKVGYTLTGWIDDTGNVFTSFDTMPDCGENRATKHLTAQWISNFQYSITIPEVIVVNSENTGKHIYAEILSLPENAVINVVLTEKSTLKLQELPSETLEYVVYANNVPTGVGENVAQFSITENDVVALSAKLADGVSPRYTGDYRDTITFTVDVEIIE